MTEHFDSHCHLTDAAFRDDRKAVLQRAAAAGVTRAVTIASSVADARAALALTRGDRARHHEPEGPGRTVRLWCTAGVHPHEAGSAGDTDLEAVRELAGFPEVVALGETGLDYHYDNAPRSVQRRLFDAHLALAAELGLPVVVHARDADEDVGAALAGVPNGALGVLHCFTGGARAFERAAEAGWYVSFSGIASFGSFGAADMLREVPRDRLLIETDAPYLAPHPVRGRRNEPANVVHVAAAVARHLGVSAEEVARSTTENARRFYGVGDGP